MENLLTSNISVLIYQGQDNAYVNVPGTMKWVDELNYPYSHEFRHANFAAFKSGNTMLGSKKSAGNLNFVIVNNAGHYIPQDNPEAAY